MIEPLNFSLEIEYDDYNNYRIQMDYDEPIQSNKPLAFFLMYGVPVLLGIYFIWLILIIKYCVEYRGRNMQRNRNNVEIPVMIHETPV